MKSKKVRRQTGIALIEILASLTILALMVAGVARLIDQYTGDVKTTIAAQHLQGIGTASQAYIKAHPELTTTATATTPVVVPVSTLISEGFLTSGYSATNNYGQTTCLQVLQPTANNLLGLVVTQGGTSIDDISLGGVVAALGSNGGAVYGSATSTMKGTLNGWSSPATDFKVNCAGTVVAQAATVGHPVLALWMADGGSATGYLHRDAVPGHPELNTMNTPVIMNAVATAGAACVTGAIGRDAAGVVLSCQGAVWKTQGGGGITWKGSVANVAALPASGNASGDVYRVTGLSNHAFIWDAQNSVWQGMVVNGAGDLTLPGIIYASGSNTNYGAITMRGEKNGWSGVNFKDAAGNSAGTLMMSPTISGFYNAADDNWRWRVNDTGDSVQAGNAQAGTLQVNTAVVEGSACSPDGKIAKSSAASGVILSCQSGFWRKAMGTGTKAVFSPLSGKTICVNNGFWCATVAADGTASVYGRPWGSGGTITRTQLNSSIVTSYSCMGGSTWYYGNKIWAWNVTTTGLTLEANIAVSNCGSSSSYYAEWPQN